MDTSNNQPINGYNMLAFQNKVRKLQTMKMQYPSKATKPQMLLQPSSIPKPLNPTNQLPKQSQKKLSPEQAIVKGRIIRIVEKTLTANEFKVECEYEEEVIELIASKQDIVKNNIIPLLDYYEKTLNLR